HLPLGRGLDQLTRDLPDALLDARLAGLPTEAAELVELDDGVLGAVARQHLDVLDRHEQLVAAVIENAQAIMRRAADLEGGEAVIAADAMVDMDDEIALGEVRELGQELVGALALLRGTGQAVADDVGFGDDGDVAGLEAGIERERHQSDMV